MESSVDQVYDDITVPEKSEPVVLQRNPSYGVLNLSLDTASEHDYDDTVSPTSNKPKPTYYENTISDGSVDRLSILNTSLYSPDYDRLSIDSIYDQCLDLSASENASHENTDRLSRSKAGLSPSMCKGTSGGHVAGSSIQNPPPRSCRNAPMLSTLSSRSRSLDFPPHNTVQRESTNPIDVPGRKNLFTRSTSSQLLLCTVANTSVREEDNNVPYYY